MLTRRNNARRMPVPRRRLIPRRRYLPTPYPRRVLVQMGEDADPIDSGDGVQMIPMDGVEDPDGNALYVGPRENGEWCVTVVEAGGSHNLLQTFDNESQARAQFKEIAANPDEEGGDNEEVISLLKSAQDKISEAIYDLNQAKNIEPRVRGQMDAYTIPWLETFISDDSNQPGTIGGFIRDLGGESDY